MDSVATRGRHASGPERGIGQFIVYALLVVFVVAAGLRWRSQQELREVRILGLHSLAESEVRQVLDFSLVPRKVADVDLQAVRRAVLDLPFVRNAVVQRVSENSIEITVTEREPLALLVNVTGEAAFLDAEAVVIPYRHLSQGRDLPVIRGISGPGGMDTAAKRDVVTLLREMRSTEGKMLYDDISEIAYDRGKRSFSMETSADASLVLFGTFDNHTEKVSNLYSLRRTSVPGIVSGAATVIDVRWKDKMFITKRPS
ncbi:MAG: cell division protein FtsQ/DivIB [Candidatus Kapaibacterium sp.]